MNENCNHVGGATEVHESSTWNIGVLTMRFPDFPTHCPQCSRPITVRRPESQLQKRAVVLLWVGSVATVLWALGLYMFVVASGMIVLMPNVGTWVFFAVVAFAPGLGIGAIAMNMKCVKVRCPCCGWSQTYKMEHNYASKRRVNDESNTSEPADGD